MPPYMTDVFYYYNDYDVYSADFMVDDISELNDFYTSRGKHTRYAYM